MAEKTRPGVKFQLKKKRVLIKNLQRYTIIITRN